MLNRAVTGLTSPRNFSTAPQLSVAFFDRQNCSKTRAMPIIAKHPKGHGTESDYLSKIGAHSQSESRAPRGPDLHSWGCARQERLTRKSNQGLAELGLPRENSSYADLGRLSATLLFSRPATSRADLSSGPFWDAGFPF